MKRAAESTWTLSGFSLFKRRRPDEIRYQLLGEHTAKLSALCARHPEIASDKIDIVFVGLESAGKSSLLQRYVKMEQLPVAKRKCTTVPFEINLHHDESLEETTATLEGKRFTKSDLQRKNRPELDETPVRIEVRGPELPTITFIDTPGVFEACHRNENSDEVAVSKAIAANYIERPNSVLVLVADISIPLRLNSVWHMLTSKVAAGRAMVAFTHADKASELLLAERLEEVADAVGAPTCVLLCNECESPGEEQRMLSNPRFAAMEHRGLVDFNRALAQIIDAANRAVIPELRSRILACHEASLRETATLGTPVDGDNLKAAQSYLRRWLVPELVACLRCPPPTLPRPSPQGDLPEFLQAAAHRRRCAKHGLAHYEEVGRHRAAAMLAALDLVREDTSAMKLGRFPDLGAYLRQRLEDATRRAKVGARLRAELAADSTIERVSSVYASLLLDLHHLLTHLNFGGITVEMLRRETTATTEERQRLAQQQVRLREAADDLEGLFEVIC